jgi:ABC-type glycerol-3-phosphate transport system substrate-binding protein
VLARTLIAAALLVILGVPFLLRPPAPARDADALRLIIVTPHVPQIRSEFSSAFDRWHFARTGRHARIDWRIPGGTAEIVKLLQAKYNDVAARGLFDLADPKNPVCPAGTVEFDLMLGGGSFDHGRLKRGDGAAFSTIIDGKASPIPIPMSAPPSPPFSQDQLDTWFGENRIGSQTLYDPDQFWLGTALSSFGIVYNRDVLARLGLPEPTSFADLGDPRLAGWVSLADPRQSGSVTTTFDSILSHEGWDHGWRTLREMTANARSFSSSSTKIPIDVSQGEAAAGLAIDFYGRAQAQDVANPAGTSRVGFTDPAGSVYIDADPVSILRGAPHPDLARLFVEFCLSEQAQSLWQFEPRSASSGGDGLGPDQYTLHRLPIRRVMYEKYLDRFTDKVNPFDIASDTSPKGWRDSIGIMMGAFAIDTADAQRAAWAALNRARSDPGFPPATLAEMENLFYALPDQLMADGAALPFTEANYAAISKDTNRWRDPARAPATRIAYTKFFQSNYQRIVELADR